MPAVKTSDRWYQTGTKQDETDSDFHISRLRDVLCSCIPHASRHTLGRHAVLDQGVRFFRCDFQVHTPRDRAWKGPDAITAEERDRYAGEFVAACRERALHAVAITDHHCMTFPPYMRAAVARELAEDGTALEAGKRLVVFRGIELTLGVPCQAIIIFDADFADELFPVVMTVLAMSQNDATESKVCSTVRLNTTTTSGDLKALNYPLIFPPGCAHLGAARSECV